MTPLHLSDITNSAYNKTFYILGVSQQFVTERCQCTNVRKSQLTGGGHLSGRAFVREGAFVWTPNHMANQFVW